MPAPQQQPGRPFEPKLADVFYYQAMKFGGGKRGAQAMADPTDFQGQAMRARESMELAMEGEGGENLEKDAYQRLMELAEANPSATIEELLNIIGRG